MNKKFLPWLILICALGLAGTAGYYSVVGLSRLFAGVATAVIIMASFLELSKITIATLLHTYWDNLSKTFKVYFTISLVILSLLTSVGIYGMLSDGYQQIANKSTVIEKQTSVLKLKKARFEQTRTELQNENTQISKDVSDLRKGLSTGSVNQYVTKSGQVITNTSTSSQKTFNTQLDKALTNRDLVAQKLETATDSITKLDLKILDLETNSGIEAELGPLRYLSKLTGMPMDLVVNWLLLIIIFVFDPLAICLVIAANFAFTQIKTRVIPQVNIEVSEPKIEMPIIEQPAPIIETPEEKRTRLSRAVSKAREILNINPQPKPTNDDSLFTKEY
jgi:hypothetical protein